MSADREDPTDRLARALPEWDSGEIAELLDEAQAQAREEVASLLRVAARRRLLSDLLEHLGARQPQPQTARQDRSPWSSADEATPAPRAGSEATEQGGTMSAAGRARYLYGVTRTDAPVPGDLVGVDGAALDHIDVPPLRAVVSPIEAAQLSGDGDDRATDPAELEAKVRAHDDVLRRLLPEGPVVPLRFGTAVADEEDARALLSRHREELQSALSRLAGAAEWGVKGYWSEEALHRHVSAAREAAGVDGPEGGAGGGTSYLLARQRRREMSTDAARVRDRVVSECHRRLSQAARDAVLLPLDSAAGDRDRRQLVLNGSYLVPQDWLSDFHETVSELSAAHADTGLVLETTGPWPPYSFVGGLTLEGAQR